MKTHKHNPGCGDLFCFHGAYQEKQKAVEKEKETPASFIKGIHYGVGDYRYAVLTPRKKTAPNRAHIRLDRAGLRRFNMAREWMQDNAWNYYDAQTLAQDASTKYGVSVADLLPAAKKIKLPKRNPLFTRKQKRRFKKRVRSAVREGMLGLVGLKSRKVRFGRIHQAPAVSRATQPRDEIRDDVISALVNQGYSRKDASRMVPHPTKGEDFTSLFKRAIKRNPDENHSETETERRAKKAFHDFHGTDPERVIRRENTIIESGDYFKVGSFYGFDLIRFPIEPFSRVRPNVRAEESGIMLCAGNIEELGNGRMVAHQLALFGGNQNLEWALEKDFDITSDTQLVDLGEIKNVWYVARKKQDNFKELHYHHTFGEEEESRAAQREARPRLIYDRINQKQFIVGGAYSVPLEGIKN